MLILTFRKDSELLLQEHWYLNFSLHRTVCTDIILVPTFVLFWFQIYNGWSATYVFAYVYILFYNSLFTLLVRGLSLYFDTGSRSISSPLSPLECLIDSSVCVAFNFRKLPFTYHTQTPMF